MEKNNNKFTIAGHHYAANTLKNINETLRQGLLEISKVYGTSSRQTSAVFKALQSISNLRCVMDSTAITENPQVDLKELSYYRERNENSKSPLF